MKDQKKVVSWNQKRMSLHQQVMNWNQDGVKSFQHLVNLDQLEEANDPIRH